MEDSEFDEASAENSGEYIEDESPANEAENTGNDAAADVKARGFSAEVYDWFDTVLYSVLAIIVIFTFFTRMSTVDGSSMYPTLEDGQRLMISNFLYTPAYNDIVVFWAEKLPGDGDERGKALVKRIIGLPGDHIEIDFTRGEVTRNGELLPLTVKDGILYEDGHIINEYTHDAEGSKGDFLVPEGCIFVMGDNRNESTDSRSTLVGYIDERDMIGRAYLRITPFEQFGGLYE